MAKQPARLARSLSEGECALLRPVFADALDYSALRIVRGKFMPFQLRHVAMSPNGSIYLPADLYHDDFSKQPAHWQSLWLHECTHVWQHRLGYPVLRCGICLALQGGYIKRAAYRYRHLLPHYRDLSQFNMEQQACIVADYFIGLWYTGRENPALAAVLQRFLQQPDNADLLPKSMRIR